MINNIQHYIVIWKLIEIALCNKGLGDDFMIVMFTKKILCTFIIFLVERVSTWASNNTSKDHFVHI